MKFLSRVLRTRHLLLVQLLCLCIFPGSVQGDALVVTKAMQASTIAEIYITKSSVRIELEIGETDLRVFANILPDNVYSALNIDKIPFTERSRQFFRDGLLVYDETGTPLTGQIKTVTARKRIERDDITGEPLLVQSTDAEDVVIATLLYEFERKPTRLRFQPPSAKNSLSTASIGFIAYHNGLPVNDFRYLATEVILDLDWNDPWYSSFQHPNLGRQYDAPVSVFLYVEPFEVRKEIIIRPKDLQQWIDLGLEGREMILVTDQESLKKKIADYLAGKNPVSIDGQIAEGKLDRIHFLRRSLRKTGVIDRPEELDIDSATLGVIFVYPTERLPQQVSMTWELFNQKIPVVPGVMTDEAGGMPGRLTEDAPVLVWYNLLTNPTVPAMMSVAPPPQPRLLRLPIISVISIIALLILYWRTSVRHRQGQRVDLSRIAVGILLLIVGVTTTGLAQMPLPNPLASKQNITSEEADTVLAALLHNVYRAFDRREESLVYDRLAQSISGNLLTDVYLQTRQSIELENQGGARVSVDDVLLQSTTIDSLADQIGFSANCHWLVSGSVGHWGHIHQRQNVYEARFVVQPINGQWKITEMELLDERRLDNPIVISRR